MGRRLPHGGRAGRARGSRAAGAYHRIPFTGPRAAANVAIETTRPELIPACVALVAHPDDERYQPLFGTDVTTPLFGVRVPIRAHALADPEKGTGIAMICTFGDITDVTWWRELSLPVRAIVLPTVGSRPVTWGARGGNRRRRKRAGGLRQDRGHVREEGADADRRAAAASGRSRRRAAADHAPVKFYEKGDRPLEIVTSRQWFIEDDRYRESFSRAVRSSHWHPTYMGRATRTGSRA